LTVAMYLVGSSNGGGSPPFPAAQRTTSVYRIFFQLNLFLLPQILWQRIRMLHTEQRLKLSTKVGVLRYARQL